MGILACNKAESPEKGHTDVAKATNEAAENNAKADETRKQTEGQAAQETANAHLQTVKDRAKAAKSQ